MKHEDIRDLTFDFWMKYGRLLIAAATAAAAQHAQGFVYFFKNHIVIFKSECDIIIVFDIEPIKTVMGIWRQNKF